MNGDITPHIRALSQLTLAPERVEFALEHLAKLSPEQREQFRTLANSHHVVVRSFSVISEQSLKDDVYMWANSILAHESDRVAQAVEGIACVCEALESDGCPVTVLKSLDHFPDTGNDIDLYTPADPVQVLRTMRRLNANVLPRSYGDRLAVKWNFEISGVSKTVEVHVKRLGQGGEHTALAERFHARRRQVEFHGHKLWIPAAEESIMAATMQRMYRHFFMRICDVANTARMIEAGDVDFHELRSAAERGCIWEGVATYLSLVCEWVALYRRTPLQVPAYLRKAGRFGVEKLFPGGRFLRVPVVPDGAKLFATQLWRTALSGDLGATFRLGLLPPLASAAMFAYKVTGNNKGIW
jgi:hypothetical protein